MSLCEQRERIQQQVELLERRLCVSNSELQQVSSDDTDDESSVDTNQEAEQSTAGLLAERQKIEKEIQNLENVLGPHSSTIASDDDDSSSSSSSESELGLSINVDSCLQMNFVYQQILEEKLKQLETLLSHNQRQQKEVLSQLSGPFKEASKEEPASSSYPKQGPLFLGHFLKPYFKDKLTGLGPPANSDTKERMMKMKGCLSSSKMKVKRWESWQKTLLIDSVSRDSLKRLIQPKLSRVDYLSQKLSSSGKSEDEKRQLKVHIESLEKDIESIKVKKDEELFGDQYEDHDWHKIAKIDFEGLREADDLRLFWQNFLHPAVNKNRWSTDEVQRLKEVSSRHKETNWDLIARELGTGRTAFMCLQTFQRFISSSLKRGTWTPAEDQKLSQLVDKMRIGNFIPYTQISYFMEGRDTPQLIYRWTSVLDPQLKKGSWSKEEDQLLLKAVARHGEKMWWKIRLEVPGRTDGACRDRYLDCLKEGLKKGPFDDHEHQLLVQLLDKHGAGRWAKIAAEIPNRNDAQCLREWKKMMRQAKKPTKIKRRPKISQDSTTSKTVKTKMSSGIRKRLQKVREEEEEEEDSSQEDKDEDQITYMDTDDEKQEDEEESVEGNSDEEDQEKEEEEESYLVPPMHEWIPQEESQEFSFPTDRLVTLDPAPNRHLSGPGSVRSTVVAKFGRSVVVGPPPRELSWEERHANGAMLMVSQKELHSHLCHQASKYNNLQHRSKKGHVTDTEMNYMLQAAVLPWVGNVLMPSLTAPTLADALGHKTALSSTPVFRLLLHAMMVDFSGCKDVILRRSRKNRTSPLRRLRCPPRRDSPLPPPRSPPKKPVRMPRQVSTQKRQCKPPGFKNPKTVAAMLHSTRAHTSDTQPVRALQQVHLLPQSAPVVCLLTMPPSLTVPPRAPPPVKLPSQTSQRLPTLLPRTPGPICLLTAPSLPVCFVSPPLPVGPTHLPPLATPPPRSSVTPALGPSTSTVTNDHAYTLPTPKPSLTGKKRARDDDPGGETLSTGGKRVRKLSHKALQLQASATERKRRSWRKSKPKEGGAKLVTPPPSIHMLSLFAHPNGGVQLPQSPNFVLNAAIRPLPSASGPSPMPLERAGLNIDPSLVFPGSPAVVSDWLSGSGGVAVPHLGISLPYLPPCSSSLSALAAIFANRTQLAGTAAQLLKCYTQTQAMPPDATSEQTESSLRALVKDHLGSNPAYLLLKARFLSVFALPAVLATVRPGATATSSPTSPCDDRKVKTKGKTQQSNILGKIAWDGSGAPANHFSGISAIGPTLPHPRDTVSNQ